MVFKNSHFPYNTFLQNFKTLKFSHDLVFHQVHPMSKYLHRRKHVIVITRKKKIT